MAVSAPTRPALNIELSDIERQARTLVETDRAQAEFDSIEQVLRSALLACWSSAMPLVKWVRIGSAIHSVTGPDNEPAWAQGMTRLARRKVVRSYVKGGQRLYELNY